MNDLLFYTILIALIYYFFYYLPQQKKSNQPSTQPFPIVNTKATQTETIIEEPGSTITGPEAVQLPSAQFIPDPETIKNLEKELAKVKKELKEKENIENSQQLLLEKIDQLKIESENWQENYKSEQKKVQETSQNQTNLGKTIVYLKEKIKEYEEVSEKSVKVIDSLEKKIKNLKEESQEREEKIKEWKETQQEKINKVNKKNEELMKENESLKNKKETTPPNPPKIPGEWNEE